MDNKNARTAGRQGRRSKWRFFFIGTAFLLVVTAAGAVWVEMRDSPVQARLFSEYAQASRWTVEAGRAPEIWFPGPGPYDLRHGYSRMRELLPRLDAAQYEVAAQARQSAGFREIVGRGFHPIYPEKSQAGLAILDRHEAPLYTSRHPRHQYADFEAIPPVLVEALLFIENRGLLDPEHPTRNPAVDWGRLSRVAAGQAMRSINAGGARAGGSTLATQIEKFRHSPGGRTHDAGDKLRQMVSASLRAYRNGEDTLASRRRIVLDFFNSVPLGGVPGYGEVNGLGDGMWAWYGREFAEVNRLLADPAADPAARAKTFKEALSLLVAQRRPSELLGTAGERLDSLTDSYVRLLAEDEAIPADLSRSALGARIAPARRPIPNEEVSFVERKAVNEVRSALGDLLGIEDLYTLDRFDLEVRSTLDGPAQAAVTRLLGRLSDPAFLGCAGMRGSRMLDRGDPAGVQYSFTLYETTPLGNALRIQADNLNQPLDINSGTKLDLGSSAKFRTLISYLSVIADLHRRYAAIDAEALAPVPKHPADRLSNWAIEYLRSTEDRGLEAMLEAAMQRRYSANPHETFFTGGGVHRFGNFKHEDDGLTPSVAEAIEQSVNLVFVRLMHDIVHYHAYEAEDAPAQGLREGDEAVREEFLNRFAEREGLGFLRTYWHKYNGLDPADRLEVLSDSVPSRQVPQAAAYLSVRPDSDYATFAAFMREQLGERAGTDRGLRQIFEAHATRRYNLSDQGYLARVHPLELWVVGYLRTHPAATLKEMVGASVEARRDAARWLFAPRMRHAQKVRLDIIVEVTAFERIAEEWRRLGYPFEQLVPSLATSIGSSADRPAALAELMGIVLSDGIRRPTLSIDRIKFAAGTPYETLLTRDAAEGERVLPVEVARVARRALLRVVDSGTARRLKDTYRGSDEKALPVGGKTGTGDHRSKVIAADGTVKSERVRNRAATFAFFIGERVFGVVTAFVPGSNAAAYDFTSALAVQVLKEAEPALRPMVSGRDAGESRCDGVTAKAPAPAGPSS